MTRSIEELQREIEERRARLDLTLDRIEDRLSLSGVADDLLGLARSGGWRPQFDRALKTLRENPAPVLLVAAGAALLLHKFSSAGRRTVPTRPHALLDEDAPTPLGDERIHGQGASALQTREDLEARGRSTTIRI